MSGLCLRLSWCVFLCVVKLAVACLLGLKGTPYFFSRSTSRFISQAFLLIGREIFCEVVKKENKMASSGKEMFKRIPMKKISEMVLTESVKTSGTDLQENWTGESAVRRIEGDFNIFDALTEFMIDLTEEEGGKAKTSKVAVTMIAYLIKQKFDNDTFIASKLQFFLHTCIQCGRFVPLRD